MRPRTKRQQAVYSELGKVKPITEAQRQWAIDHCFQPKAYISKRAAWCGCCGKDFDIEVSGFALELLGDKISCPHCGKELTPVQSRRKKDAVSWYYTIITVVGQYQVCRHFIAHAHFSQGDEAFYDVREAVQHWIDPDGHCEVVARPVKQLSREYDAWDFTKPMELRDARRTCYGIDKYDINSRWIYPRYSLTPQLKRNGFTLRCRHGSPAKVMQLLIASREAEAMAKNGQYELLGLMVSRGWTDKSLPFRHAVRIARRHGYKIKDATMWIDYLKLLHTFGRDTHNPALVCPPELKKAHDEFVKRRNAQLERQRREERIKKAREYEAIYFAKKKPYLAINISNGAINIRVIQTVAEMAEEGASLHHCVYTNGYYRRDDSLILTARDSDGNRLETVEVSLTTLQVVQSRGACNKVSSRHDEIIDLVNKNMHLIARARRLSAEVNQSEKQIS